MSIPDQRAPDQPAPLRVSPRRDTLLGLSREHIPLLATILLCAALYAICCARFGHFGSGVVRANLLNYRAFLGVAAIGSTFVILSGGIDLSVGSVIGLTTVLLAQLIGPAHVHPLLAFAIVLAGGSVLGAAMGAIIRFFDVPPFLVTLAGLFACRGLALRISRESIPITHDFYDALTSWHVSVLGMDLHVTALIFLATVAAGVVIGRFTSFGRTCYAIGGSEIAARLMGLAVGPTKIAVYALAGFCSALAGIVLTITTPSGDANAGMGLELDAIAAVVVGGTLLTGGSGSAIGTFFGVLTFGIIKTAIEFDGRVDSAWNKIVIGLLLLAFIVLQRLLQRKGTHA